MKSGWIQQGDGKVKRILAGKSTSFLEVLLVISETRNNYACIREGEPKNEFLVGKASQIKKRKLISKLEKDILEIQDEIYRINSIEHLA